MVSGGTSLRLRLCPAPSLASGSDLPYPSACPPWGSRILSVLSDPNRAPLRAAPARHRGAGCSRLGGRAGAAGLRPLTLPLVGLSEARTRGRCGRWGCRNPQPRPGAGVPAAPCSYTDVALAPAVTLVQDPSPSRNSACSGSLRGPAELFATPSSLARTSCHAAERARAARSDLNAAALGEIPAFPRGGKLV